MLKQEFIEELKSLIGNLPYEDVNKYVEYYSEMIEDRIDDGMTEEDAVKEVGSPKVIAEQILKDNGATINEQVSGATNKDKKGFSFKNLDTLSIVLIIVSFPIWVSLLAGVFSMVVGVFAGLLSLFISAWACTLSFGLCGIACTVMGIVYLFSEGLGTFLCYTGAGILLIGLSILFYVGAKYFTKLCIYLCKKCVQSIKTHSKKVKNKVNGEA